MERSILVGSLPLQHNQQLPTRCHKQTGAAMEWMWMQSELATALSTDWPEGEDFDQLLQALGDDADDDIFSMADSMPMPMAPLQAEPPAVATTPPLEKSTKRHGKISGSTRVRTELLHLRSKAKELEDQLHLIKQRVSSKRHSTVDTTTAAVDGEALQRSMWKSVAQRQYRALRDAQQVNEKLRASVEEERKTMQAFIRSLNRGTAMPGASAVETVLDPIRKHGHVVDYDEGVTAAQCQPLLQQLDTMLQSLDSAFSHACFQSNAATSRLSQPGDDGSVSVLDCHVLPFNRHTVTDSIWDYYAARDTAPAPVPHLDTTRDMLVKGFKMAHGIPALKIASCVGLIVGRRVVEARRSIIVWTTVITPCVMVGSLFPPLDMLAMQASGWEVVEELSDQTTKVSMHHTVRLGRHSPRSKPRHSMVSDVLRRLLARGLGDHQDAVHRCVDDALLQCHLVERKRRSEEQDRHSPTTSNAQHTQRSSVPLARV